MSPPDRATNRRGNQGRCTICRVGAKSVDSEPYVRAAQLNYIYFLAWPFSQDRCCQGFQEFLRKAHSLSCVHKLVYSPAHIFRFLLIHAFEGSLSFKSVWRRDYDVPGMISHILTDPEVVLLRTVADAVDDGTLNLLWSVSPISRHCVADFMR